MLRLKKFTVILSLLLVFILSTFAETVEIRILHINDFHGFVDSYKPFGSEKLLEEHLILQVQ